MMRILHCRKFSALAAEAHDHAVSVTDIWRLPRLACRFQDDAAYFARRALECRLALLGIDLND